MKQFLLTRQLVSIVNSKLSELKSILANNLDNAKKITEIDYLDWDGAIKKIDTESIKNEIVGMTDDQNTFDVVIRILNMVDFGDIYSKIEKFKDDAFFDLLEYEYEGEYVFDDFSNIIDICRTVRTEVSEMMRIYNLNNNCPKVGFLCPAENEWLEDDVTGSGDTMDKITPETQQADKIESPEVADKADSKGVIESLSNGTAESFNFDDFKEDSYGKIYKILTEYNVLNKEEDAKTFITNLKSGNLSMEYAPEGGKVYLRKLCAMLMKHLEGKKRRIWKHKIAVSMNFKDDNKITKNNSENSDKFREYCYKLSRIL